MELRGWTYKQWAIATERFPDKKAGEVQALWRSRYSYLPGEIKLEGVEPKLNWKRARELWDEADEINLKRWSCKEYLK